MVCTRARPSSVICSSLSIARDPNAVLLGDPMVETVIRLPGDATYMLKLHGSPKWIKLAPEAQPSVDIAKEWQLRAAEDSQKAVRSMQASVVEEGELNSAISGQHTLIVERYPGGKTLLEVSPIQAPADSSLVGITDGKTNLQAWVSPFTRKVHILTRPNRILDAVKTARKLESTDLEGIRAATPKDVPANVVVSPKAALRAELPTYLERQDFHPLAKEIANNPDSARLAFQERLQFDLRRNSAIREAQGPNAALHDLDYLITTYGERPDLMLRRGLHQIDKGNLEAAAESVQTAVPRTMSDRRSFFDEVNARLAHQRGDSRRDLYRYAQYADWGDRLATSGNKATPIGAVRPLVTNKHFDIEFHLATFAPGRPVSLSELEGLSTLKAVVYHQDDVALNRIDWSGSTEQSLKQVISGHLGTVVRLPQGDIAHFRPSAVWLPDDSARLTSAHPYNYPTDVLIRAGSQTCSTTDEYCPRGDLDRKGGEENVYLVLANRNG